MTKSEFVERYNVAQEYHQSCIALVMRSTSRCSMVTRWCALATNC